MARTKGTQRHEVETSDPVPTDGQQAEAAHTDGTVPVSVLYVEQHPAVIEDKRRLEDADQKLVTAAKRVSDLADQVEGARERAHEVRTRQLLGESSADEVEEAKAQLADREPKLAEAQEEARYRRAAVEVLTNRLQQTKEQARREVEAGLNERRGEVGRRLAEGAVALEPLARELFRIERAAREQGVALPGDWSLAPPEFLNVEGYRRVDNVDYAFGYHPADGTFLMEYLARLAKVGIAVEPPQPVALADLLGRPW